MTFVSHAQNFEDVRLWRAFRNVTEGRYLDIGSQDPVHGSVSLAFYERGWRGLHVEPTPAYAEAMREARPDEIVIEAAVATAKGPIPFFEIPATGLSTGIADIADLHNKAGWEYREILVPTITLAGLFDSFGHEFVHWLKIDVEGMEADVLTSWGDHPARPAALVIEATVPNSQIQTHGAWYDLVLARGYNDVAFDGLSRFFVHEEWAHLGDAIAGSPSIFDEFHVPVSHFSSGYLNSEYHKALEDLQTSANSQIAQHEAARLETDQRLAETEESLRQTAQRLTDRSAQLDRATHRLSELEANLERATSQLAETEASLGTATRRLAETEVSLKTATSQLAETEASLGTATRRLAEWEVSLKTATSHLAKTKAALGTATRRLAQTEASLSETGSRLAATEAKLDSFTYRAFKAETAAADTQNRLETLQQQHAGLLRRAGSLEGKLAAMEQANSNLLMEGAAVRRMLEDRIANSEEERRAIAAELKAARDAMTRLSAIQSQQEQDLREAVSLLSETPDILGDLPPLRSAVMRWLMPPAGLLAMTDHAKRAVRFRARAMASTGSNFGQKRTLPIVSGTLPLDSGMTQEDAGMARRDDPITSVPRLLEPHDREFIRSAYQAVLGRAPDPDGERYYLAQLRAGIHKLAILRQLRRSTEGRAFIPGVAGLDAAIKRYHWATLPLIGLLVRALTGGEGDSSNDRRFRALTNELAQVRQQQVWLRDAGGNPTGGGERHRDLTSVGFFSSEAMPSPRDPNAVRFQPVFVANAQNLYSLDEFMQLHDTSFVKAAYLAILQREPDITGLTHYVRRVREGTSKIRVLSDLMNSPEGRSKGTVISGLRAARITEKALVLPVVGGLLHFLFFSINIQHHLRDVRILENHLFRLAEESHRLHRVEIERLAAMIEDGQ